MKTYAEKLRHPNWQKKRLQILDRDGFKCRVCSSADTTLHVHHLHYVRGRDPWDYGNASLITLCEGCHSYEHETIADAESCIVGSLRSLGATNMDIIGIAVSIDMSDEDPQQMTSREFSGLAYLIQCALVARGSGISLHDVAKSIIAMMSGIPEDVDA